MIKKLNIPLPTLKRYSLYLHSLLKEDGGEWISTSYLSSKTGVKAITIRKDIGYLEIKGAPQKGFPRKNIIKRLKDILGGDSQRDLILVGSWGFAEVFRKTPKLIVGDYNLRVCFDFIEKEDKSLTVPIYPMERMKDLIPRLGVSIALLSVEPEDASEICDRLFRYGIEGILNLTMVNIRSEFQNNIVDYNPQNGLSELMGIIKS